MEAYETGPIQGSFPPLEAFTSDHNDAIHRPATQPMRVIRTLDPVNCVDWETAGNMHRAFVRE